MAERLRLRFEAPKAGWLPVRLSFDGQAIEFVASYVGPDPLEALCNSLLETLAGRARETEWFLEPESYVFSFKPAGDQLVFEVHFSDRWTKRSKNLPERRSLVLAWSGPALELVTSFWRGLKQLEHTPISSAQWKYPFPSALMRKIEAQLPRDRTGQPAG